MRHFVRSVLAGLFGATVNNQLTEALISQLPRLEKDETIPAPKYCSGHEVEKLYRDILKSILPPKMLTKDGYLLNRSGAAEPIKFAQDSFAYYAGALPVKALRHKLMKYRQQLTAKEYDALKSFIGQQLPSEGDGVCDTISIGNARHKGVLAHETFHDIQGYLYDYYPEIVDALESATMARQKEIEAWYKESDNQEWAGEGEYQLEHFFPTTYTISPCRDDIIEAAIKVLLDNTEKPVVGHPGLFMISEYHRSLGKNEAIPVLLSAAVVGNNGALEILSGIFGDAGLNKDFYMSFPRFS